MAFFLAEAARRFKLTTTLYGAALASRLKPGLLSVKVRMPAFLILRAAFGAPPDATILPATGFAMPMSVVRMDRTWPTLLGSFE